MGFYSQKILPYFLDWAMSDSTYGNYRKALLSEVTGDVLEIGFGTGLNLSYYPEQIDRLVAIDANPGMTNLARQRVESSRITVDHRVLNGESLPMPDRSFDSVVSTWTLCSISQVEQALQEIDRVLKPGGRFFFIEHGLSNEPEIQVWQNRLTPLQKVIADGCHLNRNIRQLVQQQFEQVTIEEFYADKTPKTAGYFYKGIAAKN
jgi:ubiquinone/menaquinone biosynthesis C-methylase UbiE